MRVYNKGKRAFIIDRKDNYAGCRLPKESISRDQAYIDPGSEVDIRDSIAVKLLEDYPTELVSMDGKKTDAKKPRAVKETKATVKKVVRRK